MKKIILCIICILIYSTTVFATSTYTDTKSGIKFSIPENWSEVSLSKDRETIDAKFICDGNSKSVILFGSLDIASLDDISEKERAFIDNSSFTTEDIKEMLGLQNMFVSTATINEKEYYRAVGTTTRLVGSTAYVITFTYYIRIENGWLYQFSFNNTSDDKYYDDYISLIQSVEYPYYEIDENYVNQKYMVHIGKLILGFVVVVGLAIFLIGFFNRRTEKIKKENELLQHTDYDFDDELECPNCKSKILDDSIYCHNCGTKIEKGD